MPKTELHALAEERFLATLTANGMPEPDRVEYLTDEVAFFWDERKVVVFVELDGFSIAELDTELPRPPLPEPEILH